MTSNLTNELVGDQVYLAQTDFLNFFNYPDGYWDNCNDDAYAYAFQIQDTFNDVEYQYLQNLEQASINEYNTFLSANKNMTNYLNASTNASPQCRSSIMSAFNLDNFRLSYIACAERTRVTALNRVNQIVPILENFHAQCANETVRKIIEYFVIY